MFDGFDKLSIGIGIIAVIIFVIVVV